VETKQLDPNASAHNVPLPELYIPIETANPFYKPKAGDEREDEDEKVEEGKEPAFIDIEALLGRRPGFPLRVFTGGGIP